MRIRVLLSIALLGLISACTTPFTAQVARFQALPPAAGQSFTIEAMDPAKVGSIEFASFAGFVRRGMLDAGFTENPVPTAATIVVKFDYNVGPGQNSVESTPGFDPFWGGYYGWGRPFGSYGFGYGGYGGFGRYGYGGFGGFGYGGYGGFGYDGFGSRQVYTVTNYPASAEIRINRVVDKVSLFEGRAQAVTRSNVLTSVVPNLVRAMFTGFPGNSGETVRISFDPNKPPIPGK